MNSETIDNQSMNECTKHFTIDDFNTTFNSQFNDNYDNSSKKYFSVLHINARSMNKNFDSINLLLSSLHNYPFSIIAVTETWLHTNSPPIFNIDNYELIRDDRKHGRGGGVALYVHESIKFKLRHDIKVVGVENIFIEIINEKTKNTIVGVVYRPPNNIIDNFLVNLDQSLDKLSQENKSISLMGDFNIDILLSNLNNASHRFINTLSLYALYRHIDKATRISNTTETLIDNIFSNETHNITVNGILYSDISDHLPIFSMSPLFEPLKRTHKTYEYKRKETKDNIQLLNTDLAAESWLEVFNETNINIAYENFINKFLYHYNKRIPLVRTKITKKKNRTPWITRGILRSITTRNRLYKKALQSRSNSDFIKYKQYRNKLTAIIRLSRKLYYSNKIETNKSNTNSIWNIVKDIFGKKKHVNTNITVNGREVTNPNESANLFNDYFVNIGPTLASKIDAGNDHFTQYLTEPHQDSLFFNPTTYHEIVSIVNSLKSSKSSGYDGLSVHFLKQVIHFIAPPLVHIFNLSLSFGRCPNSLKLAKVIPIYKKDDHSQIKNYRPISLLPSISKILEKIVYKRLFAFLTKHNILIPNQFGFRKKSFH